MMAAVDVMDEIDDSLAASVLDETKQQDVSSASALAGYRSSMMDPEHEGG